MGHAEQPGRRAVAERLQRLVDDDVMLGREVILVAPVGYRRRPIAGEHLHRTIAAKLVHYRRGRREDCEHDSGTIRQIIWLFNR